MSYPKTDPEIQAGWQARTHLANLPSADSSGSRISIMFDRGSWPTITELVVVSADSAVELADSTADPVKIGLWVLAFKARTHWAHFPLADCNSRPIPVG